MRLRLMLAALLCAAPVPALAQVTATYKAQDGKQVRIEAATNGDYRLEIGKVVILRLDGVEYVAVTGAGEVPPVTKFQDALTLVKAEMEKREKPGAALEDGETGEGALAEAEPGEGEAAVPAGSEDDDAAAAAEMEAAADAMGPAADASEEETTPGDLQVKLNYRLLRKNEETVGGRKGVGWDLAADVTIGGNKVEAPAGQEDSMAKRAVMSRDPELAPLAAPFKLAVDVMITVVGSSFGEDSNFAAKMGELMAEGVPIRFGEDLALVSAQAGPIDPARLVLPGPVMQAADFLPKVVPQGGGGGLMPPLP